MSTITIMIKTYKFLGDYTFYSCMISTVSSRHALLPFTNSSATSNICWKCSSCLETAVTIQSIFVVLVVALCISSVQDKQNVQQHPRCSEASGAGLMPRTPGLWRLGMKWQSWSACNVSVTVCTGPRPVWKEREEVESFLPEASTIFSCLLKQATVVKWGCNKEESRECGTIWPNLDVIYGVNTDFSTVLSPCGTWAVHDS